MFRARPLHKLQAGVISTPTEATEVTWAHHTQVTCSQTTANKYESLDSGLGQTQVHTLSPDPTLLVVSRGLPGAKFPLLPALWCVRLPLSPSLRPPSSALVSWLQETN